MGGSSTGKTLSVTLATFDSSLPSVALYVKESVPLKFAFGVYSSDPPRQGGFRHAHPQFAIDAAEPAVELAEGYEGPATVESWTVMHERDTSRARAHASLITPDGRRAWGVSNDPDLMERVLDHKLP